MFVLSSPISLFLKVKYSEHIHISLVCRLDKLQCFLQLLPAGYIVTSHHFLTTAPRQKNSLN